MVCIEGSKHLCSATQVSANISRNCKNTALQAEAVNMISQLFLYVTFSGGSCLFFKFYQMLLSMLTPTPNTVRWRKHARSRASTYHLLVAVLLGDATPIFSC